jgi:hypothetical protein
VPCENTYYDRLVHTLAGTLPDLTMSGLQVAQEQSLEAVGEKLLGICRNENILSPVYLHANSSLEATDTISLQTCKEGSI